MLPVKLSTGIHHGAQHSAQAFGNLTLVETNYPPGLKTRMHTHERSCFAILIDRIYLENVNHGSLNCAAGDVVFTPSEVIHSTEISPHGARSLIVEVSEEMISKLRINNKNSSLLYLVFRPLSGLRSGSHLTCFWPD